MASQNNAKEISKAAEKSKGFRSDVKAESDAGNLRPINTHIEIGKIAGCGKTTLYYIVLGAISKHIYILNIVSQ